MEKIYKIPEIKISMVREAPTIVLRSPTDAESAVRHLCCQNPSTESFAILYLDGQSRLIAGRVAAMGGASSLSIRASEVFQGAVNAGATAIILGHNHPSGNPRPSPEDLAMTKKLVEAAEIIGIPIVDHVIVTEQTGSYSFLDHGDM